MREREEGGGSPWNSHGNVCLNTLYIIVFVNRGLTCFLQVARFSIYLMQFEMFIIVRVGRF